MSIITGEYKCIDIAVSFKFLLSIILELNRKSMIIRREEQQLFVSFFMSTSCLIQK
jgi:hypothetical protein